LEGSIWIEDCSSSRKFYCHSTESGTDDKTNICTPASQNKNQLKKNESLAKTEAEAMMETRTEINYEPGEVIVETSQEKAKPRIWSQIQMKWRP
jgi:hypothetical protein